MKVLFLVTDDWYFLSHRLHLARGVRDAGGEVVVATSPGEGVARIEGEGFAFRPVRFRRTVPSQLLNLGLVRELTTLYRREAPDVVHHVSFLPQFYGSLAASQAGVPAVVNAVTGLGHAFTNGSMRGLPLRWAMEFAYKIALRGPSVRALFQNGEDLEHFLARGLVPEDRCSCIPGSGVDTDRFRSSPEPETDAPIVLHASRMLRSKGVEDSVEASRLLARRGRRHTLLLAGRTHPSNPEAIDEARLRAWEEEGVATWIGHVGNMPELLARSAVVLLPTVYREGVPLVLLEAAAMARAIITTDMPGCRDVVEDGVNGMVVPPRNPARIAAALDELLADPRLRAAMGAAGRQRVCERFSKEIVVSRTLDLYRELAPETDSDLREFQLFPPGSRSVPAPVGSSRSPGSVQDAPREGKSTTP